MFRLPETFALTRRRFRDFRPLLPPTSYASPPKCAPHHALARRAERGRQARVEPRPTIPHSLVSRETTEDDHPRPPSLRAPNLNVSYRTPSSYPIDLDSPSPGEYIYTRQKGTPPERPER
nr:MAG TPA: hypothetical protein [Caudoviricetes sp.]